MRVHAAASLVIVGLVAISAPFALPAAQQPSTPAPAGAGTGQGGRGGPQPPVGSLPAHRFERIADGVYYATSTGSMTVGANACIIVNDEDVFVYDPGESPAAARALVQDVKSITNKPIRFVAASHYHYDHAHGNGGFGSDVTLIGPERAYYRLSGAEGNVLRGQTYAHQAAPDLLQQRLDALKAQTPPADPPGQAAYYRQIAALDLRITQEREIVPTPPTLTYDTTLTLHRGGREIQLLNLGRGHTDTDQYLFLPKERIVCTGDAMQTGLAYMPDAYAAEWPETLERLAALDFDIVLPGHGTPFKGKQHIREFQAYLRDAHAQVMALRAQGLSAAEAGPKVDLMKHAAAFPQIRPTGLDLRTVQRMYDLAANPNAPVRHMDSKEYPAILQ